MPKESIATLWGVFREWVYDAHTPLTVHIDRLCDPSYSIDTREIANLVAKYFFSYIDGNSHDVSIPQNDIDNVFQRFSYFCKNYYRAGKDGSWLWREEKVFSHCSYQLCMLWDMSSTVVIVEEIISRKIDNILWNRDYHGADLWTGTAILLLAQFIQAYRNKLLPDREKNIWIELAPEVAHYSEEVANTLGFWKVIQGDIRSDASLRKLFQPLHFVSHENLTKPGCAFAVWPQVTEPFIESWIQLSKLGDLSKTWFFPQKVEIWGNILGESNIVLDLSSMTQRDTIQGLYDVYQKLGLNASSRIWPLKVEIGWKLVFMDALWRNLEHPDTWIIGQAIDSERRW